LPKERAPQKGMKPEACTFIATVRRAQSCVDDSRTASAADELYRGSWLPNPASANALLDSRGKARQSRNGDSASSDALQFLRINDVCRLLRISKPTLWRLRRTGEFPEPTGVTDRLIARRRSEIEEWLRARSTVNRGASIRAPGIVLHDEAATSERPRNETRKRSQPQTNERRATEACEPDSQMGLLLQLPDR
jgi:predicted DNA-binding transcriptional regulator AlpA